MKSIIVQKLRTSTVYKLVAVGSVFGFLPLFVVLGILGSMGFSTLTWNNQPVTGFRSIIAGPLIGVVFTLMSIAVFGSAVALGLWIYSKFRPMSLEYERLATDEVSSHVG